MIYKDSLHISDQPASQGQTSSSSSSAFLVGSKKKKERKREVLSQAASQRGSTSSKIFSWHFFPEILHTQKYSPAKVIVRVWAGGLFTWLGRRRGRPGRRKRGRERRGEIKIWHKKTLIHFPYTSSRIFFRMEIICLPSLKPRRELLLSLLYRKAYTLLCIK